MSKPEIVISAPAAATNSVERRAMVASIGRLDDELTTEKSKLKTINQTIKDHIESTDEFRALQDAQSELKIAKLKLEQALNSDPIYSKLVAEQNDQKFKFADLKEIMSHHLVSYFAETKTTSVEVGEDQRNIEIKAKLGGIVPETENMFVQDKGREYSISDGKTKVKINGAGMTTEKVKS